MSCQSTAHLKLDAFTRRCRALGDAACQYTNEVRDLGFGKKFNGREFYGGGADV